MRSYPTVFHLIYVPFQLDNSSISFSCVILSKKIIVLWFLTFDSTPVSTSHCYHSTPTIDFCAYFFALSKVLSRDLLLRYFLILSWQYDLPYKVQGQMPTISMQFNQLSYQTTRFRFLYSYLLLQIKDSHVYLLLH